MEKRKPPNAEPLRFDDHATMISDQGSYDGHDPIHRIRLEKDPMVSPPQMRRASELLAYGPETRDQLPLLDEAWLPFAIKRHRATRLHSDFRFRAFDQLISFASYDLPSLDPGRGIFLREMGDHDPNFMSSERRIPDGSYGAGPMLVWEIGGYRPMDSQGLTSEAAVLKQLQGGRLDFLADGKRLKGGFRLEIAGHGWRLRKLADEHMAIRMEAWDERSVLSGRTLDHIEREYQNSVHRR